MYVCVEYLPLGSAAALDKSVFMLLIPITSTIILKENISKTQLVTIFCAIVGSTLIFFGLVRTVKFDKELQTGNIILNNHTNLTINRSFDYFNITNQQDKTQRSSEAHHVTSSTQDFIFGLMIACLSGISGNLFTTMTKVLQNHLESPVILAVWYKISGMILCAILMLIFELDNICLPSEAKNWLFLAIHVSSNIATSVTYYVAFYYATAVVCNIALSLEIPFMITSQYVIFSYLQPINGSLYDLVGAGIITLAVTLPFAYDFILYVKEKRIENKRLTDEEQNLITVNKLEE